VKEKKIKRWLDSFPVDPSSNSEIDIFFHLSNLVDELMVFDQSRREAVKQAMVIDTTENEITTRSKAGTLLCAKKQHKKKKRTSFRSNYGKGNTHLFF
jgi:hypothetical protein